MADPANKAPVRIRVRRTVADNPTMDDLEAADAASSDQSVEERLVATEPSDPPAGKKKRKPNKGSFKPGVSGNKNGRPKGAKGTKTIVRKVLGEKVEIRTPEGPKKVTLFEGLLRKEVQRAADGDWRARNTVLMLARWALPELSPSDSDAASGTPAVDTETDNAIIAWFSGKLLGGDDVPDAGVPQ